MADARGVSTQRRQPDLPVFCLAESEMFRDLSEPEMGRDRGPGGDAHRRRRDGRLVPDAPQPVLLSVNAGRVSLYRLAADA